MKLTDQERLSMAPRQHRVIKGAASKLIPVLVNSGVGILRDQLDQLMPQFKESNPGFYSAYFAARIVVNQGSKRPQKADGTADSNSNSKQAA